jgi:hypothetical protein
VSTTSTPIGTHGDSCPSLFVPSAMSVGALLVSVLTSDPEVSVPDGVADADALGRALGVARAAGRLVRDAVAVGLAGVAGTLAWARGAEFALPELLPD